MRRAALRPLNFELPTRPTPIISLYFRCAPLPSLPCLLIVLQLHPSAMDAKKEIVGASLALVVLRAFGARAGQPAKCSASRSTRAERPHHQVRLRFLPCCSDPRARQPRRPRVSPESRHGRQAVSGGARRGSGRGTGKPVLHHCRRAGEAPPIKERCTVHVVSAGAACNCMLFMHPFTCRPARAATCWACSRSARPAGDHILRAMRIATRMPCGPASGACRTSRFKGGSCMHALFRPRNLHLVPVACLVLQ